MKMRETLRGAMQRMGGVRGGRAMASAGAVAGDSRRTLALPSIVTNYGPRADVMPKPTPQNLRKFAETPLARKAINTIKDRIAGMRWAVQIKKSRTRADVMNADERIATLTRNFEAPNGDDSFRSFCEQVLEDVIVGGYGAIEMQATGDAKHPLTLWPVDGASIQIRTDWDGQAESVRYVQQTTAFGASNGVELSDRDLIYVRLNARTYTPFGLGRLEVAFETINSFLSAHRYASRLASNSVVQYALWLQGLTQANHERLIRWWQDEIEGTGKVPIMAAEQKPEVLRFGGGTDADLRLQWQEFLIRMIANAFDLPPQMLGATGDVNKATAQVMDDQAFDQAIVPTARLFAESLTRGAIQKKLGWDDLEFFFPELESAGAMARLQEDALLISSGIETVNEVRARRGFGALPAGM